MAEEEIDFGTYFKLVKRRRKLLTKAKRFSFGDCFHFSFSTSNLCRAKNGALFLKNLNVRALGSLLVKNMEYDIVIKDVLCGRCRGNDDEDEAVRDNEDCGCEDVCDKTRGADKHSGAVSKESRRTVGRWRA